MLKLYQDDLADLLMLPPHPKAPNKRQQGGLSPNDP